jgi:hypothetical protein
MIAVDITVLVSTARTISSDCSNGTPLFNIVPSVRENRATSTLRNNSPSNGVAS